MRAFSPARAVWHWILSTSPGPVSAVKAGAVVASLLVTTSLNCASAFCVLPSLTTTYARACHRPATATVTCEASKENTQRRNLLLTSISGVVGSQLAASAAQGRVSWSASVSMSGGESVRPVRVCVVGAGSISREFALYHFGPKTQTVVTSIVDLDEERARCLAADVGSVQAGARVESKGSVYAAVAAESRGEPVPFSRTLAPCLAGCDLVYVGTTPNSHATLVLEALAAGKSVLMEKPLAAKPEDADAIVNAAELAQQKGQSVGMDIGMRWNPALHELRRLAVTERQLGRITSARLTLAFTQWPRDWQVQPWVAGRAEGGILREVGTHFFFGLMELFGERCVGCVRTDVSYPPPNIDGSSGGGAEVAARGTLRLGRAAGELAGLEIALEVGTDSKVGDVYELELTGERGTLLLKDFCRLKRTAPVEEWVVSNGSYGRVESVVTLIDEMRGAAKRGGTQEGGGVISVRQGRNAQRLLDAVLTSQGQWLDVEYD